MLKLKKTASYSKNSEVESNGFEYPELESQAAFFPLYFVLVA
jgi:hypothetical protein